VNAVALTHSKDTVAPSREICIFLIFVLVLQI
jgi:hypothetical protein